MTAPHTSRLLVLVAALGLSGLVTSSSGAQPQQAASELDRLLDRLRHESDALLRENRALKQRMEALERQNAELREELARARAARPQPPRQPEGPRSLPDPAPRFTPPRLIPPAPEMPNPLPRLTPDPQTPRGWQEREFNGLRYYLVPLKPQSQGSSAAAPSKETGH